MKSNLEKKELQTLKVLSKCQKRLFVPADKGRAVALENENSYVREEGDQIDEGSCALNSKCQKTIIQNVKSKMKKALSRMCIMLSGAQRRLSWKINCKPSR